MLMFLFLMWVQVADGIVQTAPPPPTAEVATPRSCTFGRGTINGPGCTDTRERVFVSDPPQRAAPPPTPSSETDEDANPWSFITSAEFQNTTTNQTPPEPTERFDWSARGRGASDYPAAQYNADGTLRVAQARPGDASAPVPESALQNPDRWISDQCASVAETAAADCQRRARNRLAMARAEAAIEPSRPAPDRSEAGWTPQTQSGPCRRVTSQSPVNNSGTTSSSSSIVCGSGDADILFENMDARARAITPERGDCNRPLEGENTPAWMARCGRRD